MKWYEVVSSFYDDGRVTANIVDEIESVNKPEDDFKSTSKCDVYIEYYSDFEEANEAVRNARSINYNYRELLCYKRR